MPIVEQYNALRSETKKGHTPETKDFSLSVPELPAKVLFPDALRDPYQDSQHPDSYKYSPMLFEALKNPSEVWARKSGNYTEYSFILYTKEGPLHVPVGPDKSGNLKAESWYVFDKNPEQQLSAIRVGKLLKK